MTAPLRTDLTPEHRALVLRDEARRNARVDDTCDRCGDRGCPTCTEDL